MAKLYDIDIQSIMRRGEIDLRNFPDQKVRDYYQKMRYPTRTIVDIKQISDSSIREELIYFIAYCFNRRSVSPKTAHYGYVLNLKRVIPILSGYKISAIFELPENAFSDLHYIAQFDVFERVLRQFSVGFHSEDILTDLDVWQVDWFNLSAERVCESLPCTTINFSCFNNIDNKRFAKKYIEHLLSGTRLSLATIRGKITSLRILAEFFPNVPFDKIGREDAVSYLEWLSLNRDIKPATYNVRVFDLIYFFEFLNTHGLAENNPFRHTDVKKEAVYQLKETSVDRHVINQIFNCLGKISEPLALMFLLIYCTGMRVSEVCQIKLPCLEVRCDNYFVRYYCQKMKKEVTNVIPKSLYTWLEDYIDRTRNPDCKYLFASPQKGAYNSSTFRAEMQKALILLDVKNVDGTPFIFRPHDFRHTMGAKMRELNIPFQYIQEQLHHESPEMTLAYTEFTNKKKIRKMGSYINIYGAQAPITTEVAMTDSDAYIEWARAHINAQTLPHGVCARPVKLGKCPHSNVCLTCPEFRTSSADLPRHKEHLLRVEHYLAEARKNQWTMQIEHTEELKKNLLVIIKSLEQLEGEGI